MMGTGESNTTNVAGAFTMLGRTSRFLARSLKMIEERRIGGMASLTVTGSQEPSKAAVQKAPSRMEIVKQGIRAESNGAETKRLSCRRSERGLGKERSWEAGQRRVRREENSESTD